MVVVVVMKIKVKMVVVVELMKMTDSWVGCHPVSGLEILNTKIGTFQDIFKISGHFRTVMMIVRDGGGCFTIPTGAFLFFSSFRFSPTDVHHNTSVLQVIILVSSLASVTDLDLVNLQYFLTRMATPRLPQQVNGLLKNWRKTLNDWPPLHIFFCPSSHSEFGRKTSHALISFWRSYHKTGWGCTILYIKDVGIVRGMLLVYCSEEARKCRGRRCTKRKT